MPLLRLIQRHPGYVLFSVSSLALPVGAALVVFTLINALWLKSLPISEIDRVVVLMADTRNNPTAESWTYGGLEAQSQGWSAFEAVAGQVVTTGEFSGFRRGVRFNAAGRDLETAGVTSQYFRLLRQSIRGRDFAVDDNRVGAERVAIISHDLWLRAFDGRNDLIGQVADAAPFPLRIIGVAPPSFRGARRGEQIDVWVPTTVLSEASPSGAGGGDSAPVLVFGRLFPLQTAPEAKRRLLQDASDERDREYKQRAELVPLREVFGTLDTRTTIVREQGAATVAAALAGLVLIAGCTTLMALLLVHYERRRRELAVRIALGATRSRLAFALIRELIWIALAGTVAALLVSSLTLRGLPGLSLPGGVDVGRLDLSLDVRVVVAALAITILTVVGGVFVPVSRFTRPDLAAELNASASTGLQSSQKFRQMLLGLHVAATAVVLVAAGLFVRTLSHGFGMGAGFDIERTAFVQLQVISPFTTSGADLKARRAKVLELTRRIEAELRLLPTVESVAMGSPPIGPDPATFLVNPKIIETGDQRHELRVGVLAGSAELLEALGVPILRGRGLTVKDMGVRPKPAIITASLALTLWPAEDALGQTVSFGFRQGRYTVVGVSSDFVYGSLTLASSGSLVSLRDVGFGIEPEYVVRSAHPELLIEPIRRVVNDIAPDAPRMAVMTGREVISRDLGRQRLGAWIFSTFGVVALVLAACGVFGLVAYLAESRRREFGVRLALGASSGHLVWRGALAGVGPVTAGVIIGLLVAAILSRVLVALLPGVSSLDPLTYTSVGVLMIGCAVAASLAGSCGLSRLEPSDALRSE